MGEEKQNQRAEIQFLSRKSTSRLTANIGQCRPIISCHTVLDCKILLKKLPTQKAINEKPINGKKNVYEQNGIDPCDSWEQDLQVCKREKTVPVKSEPTKSSQKLFRRIFPFLQELGSSQTPIGLDSTAFAQGSILPV